MAADYFSHWVKKGKLVSVPAEGIPCWRRPYESDPNVGQGIDRVHREPYCSHETADPTCLPNQSLDGSLGSSVLP